jgi:hypothetical protein
MTGVAVVLVTATIVLALVVLLAGGRHLGRIDAEESDVPQVGSDAPTPLGAQPASR